MLDIVDSIRKLFSEAGTNARAREEAAYMHYVDYLDDCERGMIASSTYSWYTQRSIIGSVC